MAHWEKVSESNESGKNSEDNVKVVSHERVKDTNPDIYVERGKIFFEKNDYKAAEKEYLEAARLSQMKTEYIDELMKFYYATRQKGYEKKADKIYKAYRKYEYDFVSMAVCGCLAYAGLTQGLLFVLIMLFAFFIGGAYYTLKPHTQFVYAARGENGKLVGKGIFGALFFFVVVAGNMFMVYMDFGVNTLLTIIEENTAWKLLELISGIVSLVIALIYFNRYITDVQRLVLKKKTGLLYKLGKVVRIGVMIVAIGMALNCLSEFSYDWRKQREWDTLAQRSEEPDSVWDFSVEEKTGEKTVDVGKRFEDVLGYDSSNLYYYGETTLEGQNAVLYEYVDDYGGAADYLVAVLEDGRVGKYYADGTWEID